MIQMAILLSNMTNVVLGNESLTESSKNCKESGSVLAVSTFFSKINTDISNLSADPKTAGNGQDVLAINEYLVIEKNEI